MIRRISVRPVLWPGIIFLAHQVRAAFESMNLAAVNAGIDNVVYLKNIKDFRGGAMFSAYFKNWITVTTDFVEQRRLCRMDGIAYKAGDAATES